MYAGMYVLYAAACGMPGKKFKPACMYAYMHACMYELCLRCAGKKIEACTYSCMHVCMYARVCGMHVKKFKPACMYVCMYVCVCGMQGKKFKPAPVGEPGGIERVNQRLGSMSPAEVCMSRVYISRYIICLYYMNEV
jgi:hypothetical protein